MAFKEAEHLAVIGRTPLNFRLMSARDSMRSYREAEVTDGPETALMSIERA